MVIRYNYKLRSNNVTVELMLPQTPWHPEMSPPLVLTSAIESLDHTVRLCVWGVDIREQFIHGLIKMYNYSLQHVRFATIIYCLKIVQNRFSNSLIVLA